MSAPGRSPALIPAARSAEGVCVSAPGRAGLSGRHKRAPRVSVVIPAYNVEAYIDHSLASVLQQTFTDFEVLVVDDGSRDGTVERVRCCVDPRVRLISQANRGLAGARNTGIRHARGEYVALLDADDLWHPEKLARHVAHLDANPALGVSYSASQFIDEAGQSMGLTQSPRLTDVRAEHIFQRNPVGNGSAPVLRARALADIAFLPPEAAAGERWFFDERFRSTEDVECWVRLALKTPWRFEGLAEPLTLYRVNASGLSANRQRQFRSWEQMVEATARYAPLFVASWAPAARGYQLRYLARRALRDGHTREAASLLWAALRSHPAMWREEFVRTALTCVCAAAQSVLPTSIYRRIEAGAMRVAGAMQRAKRNPILSMLKGHPC